MKLRDYLLLALLGLSVSMAVSTFQPVPGYMDADYYFAGGIELAVGKGFSEPYLWNYLDDPTGLPHPSHAYWMPLVSILAAVFPALVGSISWFVARIPFLLIALCIPLLTTALTYNITRQRFLALVSGILAVFSSFYLPYLTTSDSFGSYMLFGGLLFLLIAQKRSTPWLPGFVPFTLGIFVGLMHLSRADGILWLVMAFGSILFTLPARKNLGRTLTYLLIILSGYLLVMAPWFLRNYTIFGSILAPNASKLLWLTSYDQIFSYPASHITVSQWWQSGFEEIIRVRLWSLGLNMATTLTVQGGIFLLPLILIGIWKYRKVETIRIAVIAWLLTLVAMTFAFPFAGARGGFFHSGAAMQVIWWAMAPVGLESVIQWGTKHRRWNESKSRSVFFIGLVGLTVLMTIFISMSRISSWKTEFSTYKNIDQFLSAHGMSNVDVVIVSNPPGFFLASSNPAIAIPDGNMETIIALRDRFSADYLILEKGSMPSGLVTIYENPNEYSDLDYLGEMESVRVYRILP